MANKERMQKNFNNSLHINNQVHKHTKDTNITVALEDIYSSLYGTMVKISYLTVRD